MPKPTKKEYEKAALALFERAWESPHRDAIADLAFAIAEKHDGKAKAWAMRTAYGSGIAPLLIKNSVGKFVENIELIAAKIGSNPHEYFRTDLPAIQQAEYTVGRFASQHMLFIAWAVSIGDTELYERWMKTHPEMEKQCRKAVLQVKLTEASEVDTRDKLIGFLQEKLANIPNEKRADFVNAVLEKTVITNPEKRQSRKLGYAEPMHAPCEITPPPPTPARFGAAMHSRT